jgi:hypothetical protein
LHDLVDCEPRERSAQVLRDSRMQLRVTAHVRFVDDRSIPRDERLVALLPIKVRIDDDALGNERRAVALVEREVIAFRADGVAETGRVPTQLADELARVRIEQELVRIEAMTLFGLVRSVHSVAVHGAGSETGQVTMPDFIGVLGQLDAIELLFPLGIE